MHMRAEWACGGHAGGHAVDTIRCSRQRPDLSQLVGVGNAMLLIKVPYDFVLIARMITLAKPVATTVRYRAALLPEAPASLTARCAARAAPG